MRIGGLFLTLLALVIAGGAGFLAYKWLDEQRRIATIRPDAPPAPKIDIGKIVIATVPLRFGADLSPANIKEIDWPAGAVPKGAFTSIEGLLKSGERRVVLSAIEPNEPILKWKITGPGQRASLSAVIEKGMKAVTIRVNDVLGVAGFVLPGDRVDIVLTRTQSANGSTKRKKTFNDVILQNIRVLGIDQIADDRTEQPSVAKAVTLEVSTTDAQRLALASAVGTMSLVLRSSGNTAPSVTRRIGLEDLAGTVEVASVAHESAVEELQIPPAPVINRNSTIGVFRATSRAEYTVPIEPDSNGF